MKARIKFISSATALLAAGAIGAWIAFATPLVPSEDYTVTATLNGRLTKAVLLEPLLMPGVYYLKISEAQPTDYRWFGVAFSRQVVFSPIALPRGCCGITYIHRDQAKGVNLLSGKIEDSWKVTFGTESVHFSNDSLTVDLSRTR